MSKALKLSAACFCMFFLAHCSRRNVRSEASLLSACSELEPLVRQQGCQPNLEEECTNEEVQAIADGGGEPFDCSESAMRANGTYGLVECVPVENRCMTAYRKWRSLLPNADASDCENKPGFYDSNNDGVCESVFDGYSHCTRGVCTCDSGNGFVGDNCNVQAVTNTVSFPAKINNWWFVKNPNTFSDWAGKTGISYWRFYTREKLTPTIPDGVVKYSIDMKGLTDVKSITIPSLVWVTAGFQDSLNVNRYDLPATVPAVLGTSDNTVGITMFGYLRAVFRNTDDSEFEKQLCEYRLIPGKRITRRGCSLVDGKIVTPFAAGEIPSGAKLIRVDAAAKYFDIRSDSFMSTQLKPNACDENKTSCMLNCLGDINKTTCENTCETSRAACAASTVYQQISVTVQPSTRNVVCTSSFAGTFQGYQCEGVPNNLCRPAVAGTCCGDNHVQSDEVCDQGAANVSETTPGSDLTKCTTSCVYVGCNKNDIKANGTYTPFASDDWVTRDSVVTLNPSHCPERFGAPVPSSLTCNGGRWTNNGVFTCSELVNQGVASANSLIENGDAASVVWSVRERPTSAANLVFNASIGNELSFTSPMSFTNNGVEQTQQISAINDLTDDPNKAVVLSGKVQSADPRFNGIRLSNNVFNTVNIHHARVLVNSNVNTTSETGATARITVSLSVAPSNSITVNAFSNDTTEGTVNPSGVVLNAGRLSANVVLTGQNDYLDDDDVRYDVNFTTSSTEARFSNMAVNSLSFTNTDNDTSSLVTSCAGNQTREQSGFAPVNCVLRLSSEPFNNVHINVSTTRSTEGNVVAGGNLTFTTVNWNTNQTYRVQGVDDFIDDGDIPYNIVFNSVGNDSLYVSAASSSFVPMVNIDDDTANVVFTPSSGNIVTPETGALQNLVIKLTTQPVNDVFVSVSSSDATEGRVKGFVSSNVISSTTWVNNTVVQVNAVNDDFDDGDVSYTYTATLSSADPKYNGKTYTWNAVTTDDDVANVIFTVQTNISVNEGGFFQNAVVARITAMPRNAVTVRFTTSIVNEIQFGAASFQNLVFEANMPVNSVQYVHLNGVVDNLVDGDQIVNVFMNGVSSAETSFNQTHRFLFNAVSVDTTPANVVVVNGPTSYYTTEWGSSLNNFVTSTFSIKLQSKPITNVSVRLAVTEPSRVYISSINPIIFTPTNFNTPQNVVLTGMHITPNQDATYGDAPYSVIANATGSLVYNGKNFVLANMVSIAQNQSDEWIDVSIGSWFACAVDRSGRVFCWGDQDDGMASHQSKLNIIQQGILRFKNISAGSVHACGMTTSNEVYCWGANGSSLNYGQTGIGLSKGPASPTNAVVASINGQTYSTWKNVSSNFMHTCGVLSTNGIYNNTAWCWGNNRFGQLGANIVSGFSATPVLVGNESMKWVKIGEGGSAHTCGITDSNKIKCWGYHAKNLIINNVSQSNIIVPTDVYLIQNNTVANAASWKDISTGTFFVSPFNSTGQYKYSQDMDTITYEVSQSSCAIDMANDVWCWGYTIGSSTKNKLSNAPVTSGSMLRKVPPLSGSTIKPTSVSVYRESATVTTQDSRLAGFGRNDFCESGIYNASDLSDLRYVNYTSAPGVSGASSLPTQMKKTKQGLFASCHLSIANQIVCFFQSDNGSRFWPSLGNLGPNASTICISAGQGDYNVIGRPNQ